MNDADHTVLVTGCGAPGAIGTLWSLGHNPDDRSIRTVGVDMRDEQPGRYACDSFATVPAADSDQFLDELIAVCDEEDVDVLLPQVTAELPVLASASDRFERIGTDVAVSHEGAIERANNKRNLVEVCNRVGVPSPETIAVGTWTELESAAHRLGYPDERIVVKPPVANGQRGFRIVSDDWDRKRQFYEEKPSGEKTTMDRLRSILGESFPELLVMEYLPGEEFSIDAFRGDGEMIVVPRSRDEIRSGISFRTTVTKETALVEHAETLAEALDLEYAFGFQFKRANDGTLKILECNPRIQGTMVASTLAGANLIDAAVRCALGDPIPDCSLDWGTTFHRYWGGISVADGEIVGNIGESV